MSVSLLGLAFLLTACGDKQEEAPRVLPEISFAEVSANAIPGFNEDRLSEALPALQKSCARYNWLPDDRVIGPDGLGGTAGDWALFCDGLKELQDSDDFALRRLVAEELRAFEVVPRNAEKNLFTGYFEIELEGSRDPLPPPAVPLYRLPEDMIRVDLSAFDSELEGKRILGRVEEGRLLPYHDRAAIDGEAKVLEGQDLELLWARDPVDAFFLHIQGSGRVSLPDGSTARVGFAGSNGLRFTGIGRLMLDRGLIDGSQASAQGIAAWLRAHPAEAQALMAENARYIFFREIEGEGPIGAFSVPLTAGRSLAIDPAFIPLGAPLFLETTWPGTDRPLRRMVVAQDTGAAIKGPVRGDLFWGTGDEALEHAGRMKQKGRYFLFLPRAVGERLNAKTS